MTEIDMSEYVSMSEYARNKGLTRQRINQLVKKGKIDAVKFGSSVMIPKDAEIKRFSKYDSNPEGYLTVTEFAEKVGVCPNAVRYWIRKGYIDTPIVRKHKTYIKADQRRPIMHVGRIAVPNNGQKTRAFTIVCTSEQAEVIFERASSTNMSISEYVRKELGLE